MADGVPDSGKCSALVTWVSFGAGAELGELLRGELGHLQKCHSLPLAVPPDGSIWSFWQTRDVLDQCGFSLSY